MSPEQRREAIITATVPLVRVHGPDVSTKQIAEAADVAEGTIFRVFADKDTLVRAAVHAALDPSEADAQIRAIDMAAPLGERLVTVAELLQRRMTDVMQLATTMGQADFHEEDSEQRSHQYDHLHQLLAAVFEPDRHRLRCEPAEAARLLQVVAFGGSHPRLAGGVIMRPVEIVDLVLNGIVVSAVADSPP